MGVGGKWLGLRELCDLDLIFWRKNAENKWTSLTGFNNKKPIRILSTFFWFACRGVLARAVLQTKHRKESKETPYSQMNNGLQSV